MFFQIIYYILEAYVVFLFIMGTWRLAQSTKAKGGIVSVSEQGQSEEKYKFYKELNPLKVLEIYRWFISWKKEPEGIADMVILKKQFNWGLRFLIIALIFQYVLAKLGRYFLIHE